MQFTRKHYQGDKEIQDTIELANLDDARILMDSVFMFGELAADTWSSEDKLFHSGARYFTIRAKDGRILWHLRYSKTSRDIEPLPERFDRDTRPRKSARPGRS